MWAGVQKVSRPIVMCHEMSHSSPTMMLVEPASIAVRYQGRRRRALPRAGDGDGRTGDGFHGRSSSERSWKGYTDLRGDVPREEGDRRTPASTSGIR